MNQVAKKKNQDVALASMFEQDQAGGMDQMGRMILLCLSYEC